MSRIEPLRKENSKNQARDRNRVKWVLLELVVLLLLGIGATYLGR
jgi:hypothetical protein